MIEAAKQAAALAGKIDAGWCAKAERANVIVKFRGAKSKSNLDSADVAGIGQNVRDGQHAIFLVIVDEMAGDSHGPVFAIEDFFSANQVLIEGGSERYQFESGTWLIN